MGSIPRSSASSKLNRCIPYLVSSAARYLIYLNNTHIVFEDACGNNNNSGNRQVKPNHIIEKAPTLITSTDKEVSIKVFPNPTKGIINIEFPENEKGSWQLSLKDIYGKIKKEITISEGSHTVIMKIEGSSGIYILNVLNINTGNQEIVKVILQ